MKKITFILLFLIVEFSFALTPQTIHRYFCNSGTWTLSDVILESHYNRSWFSINDPTSQALANTTPLVDGAIYYNINTVHNRIRYAVTIHLVDTIDAPRTNQTYEYFCANNFPTIHGLDVQSTNLGSIIWFYEDNNTGTPIEYLDSYYSIIYGFQGLGNCASSVTKQIVLQESAPAPTGPNEQYFLSADNPTLADIEVYGQNIVWYGSPYGSSTPDEIDTPLHHYQTHFAFQGIYDDCKEYLSVIVHLDSNFIKGSIKYDMNNDGCDINDIHVPQFKIVSTNGTATYTTFSTNTGNYTQNIFHNLGDFTTTVVTPSYFDVTPISQLNTFVNFGMSFTDDFCLTANQTVNNVDISIIPIRAANPGFNARYKIVYKNIGTTQLNGAISFVFNGSKMNFLTASETLNSQTTNSLSFNYSNLNPFEKRSINLEFNIAAPPTTNIGDILHFSASLTPTSNTFNLDQTVIGSYDPNDITCLQGDEIPIEDTDKYLHYVIRFQNTGTAPARNVTVKNELDTKLDWNTLKIESYSHENRIYF